jgi:hypothetical protein
LSNEIIFSKNKKTYYICTCIDKWGRVSGVSGVSGVSELVELRVRERYHFKYYGAGSDHAQAGAVG